MTIKCEQTREQQQVSATEERGERKRETEQWELNLKVLEANPEEAGGGLEGESFTDDEKGLAIRESWAGERGDRRRGDLRTRETERVLREFIAEQEVKEEEEEVKEEEEEE